MRVERIGNATLYLGDCMEILPALGTFDAVVTDPPYGLGHRLKGGTWNASFGNDQRPEDMSPVLAAGRDVLIWGGNYYRLPVSRGWICWFKPDANLSAGQIELAWTNLDMNAKHLRCSIAETREAEGFGHHPTQKPERVMRFSIEYIGSPRVVLDPFMGSGSTGVAAMQCGAEFVGIELDAKYFDIACERIENAQRQERLFA